MGFISFRVKEAGFRGSFAIRVELVGFGGWIKRNGDRVKAGQAGFACPA